MRSESLDLYAEPWQWLAGAVVSAIPIVESYFGAAIGVMLGLPLLIAVLAEVSLLGQTTLPSQITSAALVSFGANRQKVIVWQVTSIVLWGTLLGILATLGLPVRNK